MAESSSRSPIRVVIAGGGVAAVELLLALRELADDRVAVEVLAPNRELAYRPFAVAEPFGIDVALRFDLDAIVTGHGARLRDGALASVNAADRRVKTADGKELEYDVLAIATGARARAAVPGAVTLMGQPGFPEFAALLEELATSDARRVVFAVPRGVSWPLPVYELALMTQTWLGTRGRSDIGLTLVTPEHAALQVFGKAASDAIGALLAERGVQLLTERYPAALGGGELAMETGETLACDAIVALPVLEGPAIPGLPSVEGGFIPVDGHGAVAGEPDVYAAGDATDYQVKQGGIATQQADAVAQAIAARAGADITPEPFDPILRGLLLTGNIPTYLQAHLGDRTALESEAALEPMWWPPTKIAGHYFGTYLAELAALRPPRPESVWLRLETDDLEPYLQPAQQGGTP